jgi:prolipoprotein diacylglyceryltransferase
MNRFAFLLGLGCALGVWNMARRSGRQQVSTALLILAAALLGARLVYVWVHLQYYSHNFWEALSFPAGGLDGTGALIGGLLAWGWAAVVQHRPLLRALDEAANLLIPLILAVWLGCWLAGVAYGPALPSGSFLSSLDWKNAAAPHWPLPFLTALGLMVAFYWIENWLQTTRPGLQGGLILMSGLFSLLWVSFLRSDAPAPLWNGLRVDMWVSLGLCVVCLSGWLSVMFVSERKAL